MAEIQNGEYYLGWPECLDVLTAVCPARDNPAKPSQSSLALLESKSLTQKWPSSTSYQQIFMETGTIHFYLGATRIAQLIQTRDLIGQSNR